jgi:uncharacterized membrane protein (DUF485 family)
MADKGARRMDNEAVQYIRHHPKFLELERKRSRFAWTLSALILAIYFGFILLVGFAPGVLGQPLSPGSATTVGMPIGVGVILAAILLTGAYVWRANGEFDRLTREVLESDR